jgi:hypothetical protein
MSGIAAALERADWRHKDVPPRSAKALSAERVPAQAGAAS